MCHRIAVRNSFNWNCLPVNLLLSASIARLMLSTISADMPCSLGPRLRLQCASQASHHDSLVTLHVQPSTFCVAYHIMFSSASSVMPFANGLTSFLNALTVRLSRPSNRLLRPLMSLSSTCCSCAASQPSCIPAGCSLPGLLRWTHGSVFSVSIAACRFGATGSLALCGAWALPPGCAELDGPLPGRTLELFDVAVALISSAFRAHFCVCSSRRLACPAVAISLRIRSLSVSA